eukprot:COSAG02_NODE_589_length_19902_cov_119.928939_8_plen_137_part_00
MRSDSARVLGRRSCAAAELLCGCCGDAGVVGLVGGGLVAGRAARPAASLRLQLHLNHSRAHALAELCFVLRFHLLDLNKLCEAQLSHSISTRAWSDAAGGLVAGRAARAAQTCSVPCISPPAAEIAPISDHKEFEQ